MDKVLTGAQRPNEQGLGDSKPVNDALAFGVLTGLTPVWGVSSRVTAFATTRLGGVSQSPYDSLNLGLHVGDDEQAVLKNRHLLQGSFALPEQPLWLNQTHSTEVVALDGINQTLPDAADGAWTDQSDTVLVVMTADCLPVVISNTEGTELAVVHAGWRGLAGGILEKALEHFSADSELHAWLGPAIGPAAFEVGVEVREAYIERNPVHARAFKAGDSSSPEKYWADLYALARTELLQSRSVNVTGGDYCTWTQSQWFHSYRRDGACSGRMATVAWMSEP